MPAKPKEPRIPLPKGWQGYVKSAVLLAIALAHYAIVYARTWSADGINARVRLSAENDRLQEDARCCTKNSASRTPAPRRSRRSDARITPSTSAWRSSSFVPREAGVAQTKPPTPSSSQQPQSGGHLEVFAR